MAVKLQREIDGLAEHSLIICVHCADGIDHGRHVCHGHAVAHALEEIKDGRGPQGVPQVVLLVD